MNAVSSTDRNVLGLPLKSCSHEPMTGFGRDGCCRDHPRDQGRHLICAVMTQGFLAFTQAQGNDLSTPYPAYGFPGLRPGDRWCVCVDRWIEARNAGVAPLVDLNATHESVLGLVPLSELTARSAAGARIVRSMVSANGFALPS